MKEIWINRRGQLRWGWVLCAAAIVYAAAAVGVPMLYWSAYEFFMNVWNVTDANIHLAPGAVKFLYQWSNVLAQLCRNGVLVCGARVLLKAGQEVEKRTGSAALLAKGAAMGAGCVALAWCVLMLLGSVRLGWRITRPVFSVNTFALLLTGGTAAAAEGLFFYRSLYGAMKQRLPAWAALCVVAAMNVLMLLASGTLNPTRLINGAMMALVCALLTDRMGAGAAIGFRFAWSYLDQAVLGFAGAQTALYETYPVNMYWLSGGNGGLMCGLLTTLMLCAAAVMLVRGRMHEYLPVRKESGRRTAW